MEKIALTLYAHLEEMGLAMAGSYRATSDILIKDFLIEFYDIDIPRPHHDRENLKKDRGLVSSELKKAVDDKKMELSE
ncbi:MAG: hypothetical protein JSS76_10995 [Bacteroidetes bacterium]|nr:hypothetical protein [Bacteroidota bacterium]